MWPLWSVGQRRLALPLSVFLAVSGILGAVKSLGSGRVGNAGAGEAARRLLLTQPTVGGGDGTLTSLPADVPDPAGATSTLLTSIAYGDNATSCHVYDAATQEWGLSGDEHGATGGIKPSASAVQWASRLICNDSAAAAQRLADAVGMGGWRARAWVYASLHTDCPWDVGAAADTYDLAIRKVNSGLTSQLPAIKAWLNNYVAAADRLSIPMCASLAVVDRVQAQVLEQHFVFTGSQQAARRVA